jgi:hypothetical protein
MLAKESNNSAALCVSDVCSPSGGGALFCVFELIVDVEMLGVEMLGVGIPIGQSEVLFGFICAFELIVDVEMLVVGLQIG